MVIHSKSQGIYFTQGDLSNVFQVPLNELPFVEGKVGGGFRAMNSIHTDLIVGLLALKTGINVKFKFIREGEMKWVKDSKLFEFKW